MSRLFASICNQPQALSKALEPVKNGLFAKGPIHRWGLGYAHLGEVCLRLHPKGDEEGIDFYDEIRSIKADYIVGAALPNADGLKGNANTQPFRFRRWLFAQTGACPKLEAAKESLTDRIPGYLQRNIKGKTSQEFLFHLFLATLHEDGTINNPNLEVDQVRNALSRTLEMVRAEVDGVTIDNIICSNSRVMLGASLGTPLYVCRLSHQMDPKRPESAFRAVLVVSSNEKPGEGFEPIPLDQTIAIKRSVYADILPLKTENTSQE